MIDKIFSKLYYINFIKIKENLLNFTKFNFIIIIYFKIN